MNTITWLIGGAVLGWLTSIVIRRRRSAQLFNIIVGMIGAFVGGYLVSPLFHISTTNPGTFSLPALLVSLGSSVFLLVVVNYFRREANVKNVVIERKWAQVRDKIPTRWGKLTEADTAKIDGDHNRFIATLQERYGYTRKEAEDQIQRFLKSVLDDSGHSYVGAQTQAANLEIHHLDDPDITQEIHSRVITQFQAQYRTGRAPVLGELNHQDDDFLK